MIKVRLNRQSFQYDVHSLVRAFYPGETVQVDCDWPGRDWNAAEPVKCQEISVGSGENTAVGSRENTDTEVLQGRILFLLEVFISEACPAAEIDICLRKESGEKLYKRGDIGPVGLSSKERDVPFAGPVHSKILPDCDEAAFRRATKNELKRLLYQILSEYSGKTLPWGNLTGIRPTKIPMALLNCGWSNHEIAGYMRDTYYTGDDKIALAIEIANRERSLLGKLHQSNTAGNEKRGESAPGKGAFDRGYSLYIGIPFCPSICLYCSFSSSPIALWKDQVDAYLDTLIYEMERVAAMLPHSHPDTVYIGGGTPTTLEPKQLDRLLRTLEEHFDLKGAYEFTVEAGRPDSITEEKLQVLKAHQVTRISINPQTMNQKTLDFIGRKHTTEQTAEAFSLARRMGFDNINMDLIVGLPGEGAAEVEHTMQVLSRLDPDSITVHSLAVKRAARLRLFQEEHQELSFENSSAIMDMTARYTRAAGLHPYYLYRQKNMAGNFENVGYAREGREGLYNILTMEEVQSIIALGAGASTKLVLPQTGSSTAMRSGMMAVQTGSSAVMRSGNTLMPADSPAAMRGGNTLIPADSPAAMRGETAVTQTGSPADMQSGMTSLQTSSGKGAPNWDGTRIERIENVKDIKNYMERIDEMIERKQSALCGKEGGAL